VALVVAVADNGVIGRQGALPWRLPDDLKHFRALTLGKPVLMGRRTFESIGRALPGRRNLILTRGQTEFPPGVEAVPSVEAARLLVAGSAQLCVIGGAEVYRLALPLADRIYLTLVHAAVAGDTYFPLQALTAFRETARVEHAADAQHAYAMSFVELVRS
jgi:dihydrofolate reductase